MIGQTGLRNTINKQLESNTFPHFSIFIGDKGSGRKTLLKELFPRGIYPEDIKVESVRKIIEMAYTVRDSYFIIPDADEMSVNAKNALLKVVEECPNNNYFIMTLKDEANTLETILSRARIYEMEEYTIQDKLTYYRERVGDSCTENETEFVMSIAANLGEVDVLVQYGIRDFYEFVQLFVDNIFDVELANAFKSSEKLAIKTSEGYDLLFFWKCFMYVLAEEDLLKYANVIKITSAYLVKLYKLGANKQQLYDLWLLEIRSERAFDFM